MAATAPTPIESLQLLTVADVAAILKVSRSAVYQMVKEGALAPVPLPIRKTRFRRVDVESLIAASTNDWTGTTR